MLGPRKADGSLPDVDFLKLKEGSRAIDKGEDVGFPFTGTAPDLGAFEYGVQTTFIAKRRAQPAKVKGSASVFDAQGRYLNPSKFYRICVYGKCYSR